MRGQGARGWWLALGHILSSAPLDSRRHPRMNGMGTSVVVMCFDLCDAAREGAVVAVLPVASSGPPAVLQSREQNPKWHVAKKSL